MTAKLCAVWLVTLILLPFSAPFSTCEFATKTPFASLGDTTTHVLPARTAHPVRFGLTPAHDAAGRTVLSPVQVGHPATPLNIGASPQVTPLRI